MHRVQRVADQVDQRLLNLHHIDRDRWQRFVGSRAETNTPTSEFWFQQLEDVMHDVRQTDDAAPWSRLRRKSADASDNFAGSNGLLTQCREEFFEAVQRGVVA